MHQRAFGPECRVFLFDIDGTLKGDDGVSPRLLSTLFELREQGHRLGLCTSQTAVEISEFVTDELGSSLGPTGPFNGGYILEDGHVWVPPLGFPEEDLFILTSTDALSEMEIFKGAFLDAWTPAAEPLIRDCGWGTLADVPTLLVQLLPPRYQAKGSVTVWERGPDITSSSYKGEYEAVMLWAQAVAGELRFRHVDLLEAGNGTLRVLQKGMNKGAAMVRLGFSPAQLVFVGNGLNDLPAARRVRKGGGMVLTVANAIPELKRMADFVSSRPASAGVVELLNLVMSQRGDLRGQDAGCEE